jgi:hypothetical protein
LADDALPEDCAYRTSEIYPIRSVAGVPSEGARVKVEIVFEKKEESRGRKSNVTLTSDAAVCRSPNPMLKPEERGWLELGLSPRLSDLKHVKKLVGFDGFRVTVLPTSKNQSN